MRTTLVIAGKLKQGPERALFDHYARRLKPPPELCEVEEKRNLDPRIRMKSEGEKLLAAVPDGAFAIALDAKGESLSSRQLAERLGALRDQGRRELAFLIGGADGLDRSVVEKADLTLSLGALTWPHKLVPGLLAEQLFRAQSILSGHPYHRE